MPTTLKEEPVRNVMKVEHWGRCLFLVTSESIPDRVYQVDLVANNGIGHCSCPDFAKKRQPLIDAGGKIGDENLFCKHIRVSRSHFLDNILSELSKIENAT
jgi:hypothetical protein